METIGSKLKAARENLGMTQVELAELMGVSSFQIVYSWESDRYYPDITRIAKLCRLLKINYEYLFGELEISEQTSLDAEHAAQFNCLDEIGKWIVYYNIEQQYLRNSLKGYSENDELVLTDADPHYYTILKRLKDLKPMYKQSGLSYEAIAYSLWNMRGGFYRGKINIFTLSRIINGKWVPCEPLYYDLQYILVNAIHKTTGDSSDIRHGQ